jgi:predicted RecA/RadA family phage recombinase
MSAVIKGIGNVFDHTPSSDVSGGTVIKVGNLLGIAIRPVLANEKGAFGSSGLLSVTRETDVEFTAGDIVYFNLTTQEATDDDTKEPLGFYVEDNIESPTDFIIVLMPPTSITVVVGGGGGGGDLLAANNLDDLDDIPTALTNLGLDAVDNTSDANKPISDDTQAALDDKEDLANKDATGGYAGLTLFKINFKNALNTITSFLTNANTVARTYLFQDRDGTIADDTDITAAKARGNHTGTQTASTVSDFNAAALTAAPAETGGTVATLLHASTNKGSLVDADEINGTNSANSFSLIRSTWTQVKAFLKTYFDTIYEPIGGGGGLSVEMLQIKDEKSSGTAGGSTSATTWHTRDLNTVASNTITGASLSSNQITLPAGTYRVFAQSEMHESGANRLRLRNITDSSTVASGANSNSGSSGASLPNNSAILGTRFTIAGTKTFELQHYAKLAKATIGLGIALSTGEVEVYSEITIFKE